MHRVFFRDDEGATTHAAVPPAALARFLEDYGDRVLDVRPDAPLSEQPAGSTS